VQLTASEDIASGKAVYQKNCKLCHDEGGKGSTGPNLTDAYWKHGGGVMNIYNTITNGVPAKGMQSWAGQLSEEDILKVTSYILSLEGTDPPGAKAPEGDIWLPEESEDNIMTMTESDSL
jgi:cytochrome c oxidase cbb3-type subunit 3